MPSVIKPTSAKVTKVQLLKSEYFINLNFYYLLLGVDFFVLWTKWLGPNLRAITILQLSFLLCLSNLYDETLGVRTDRQLFTSAILTFGVNMGLYHLLFA